MQKAILELNGVSKVYSMGEVSVVALKDISLTVREGEFVAIVGASGSGKSTLLNLIGVLDNATSGQVVIDGVNVTGLDESHVARIRGKKIGFIFQAFNLSPTLNVFENVALPMRIHEMEESAILEKVSDLIRLVGLSERSLHLPAQLSGGERQRVAVGRALSTNPALILADEPTGNLDTHTSNEIIGLLEDLNHNQGKTIVLVTHEPDIASHADRLITVRDGEIISDDPIVHGRKSK